MYAQSGFIPRYPVDTTHTVGGVGNVAGAVVAAVTVFVIWRVGWETWQHFWRPNKRQPAWVTTTGVVLVAVVVGLTRL